MIANDPNPFAQLPEQFGRYMLLGHLATGGMAEVWLARQLGLEGFEKTVVIKRARPELIDRETTRLFLDEARLVATLEHPNIAQVYEIGQVGGSYFFVMEYVEGADLRRLIEASLARRQRIPLADAIYMITHVCAALHYAHDKRDPLGRPLHLVHRDVSPSNVLLSHDGAVKVCDFGIAKAHNREAEDTQSGVLKGKFSYMSPEQCEGKPVDRRSDIFSIGVLLYELTTLTKLFRGPSDYALLQKIVQAPIPSPSSRHSDYPLELEHIVMKALAKSPEDRYPSAQALQLDLEEFAREQKLAMSSVRIAALMSTYFDRQAGALQRAHRMSTGRFNDAGAATARLDGPVYMATGSAPQRTAAELNEQALLHATGVVGRPPGQTGVTGLSHLTGATPSPTGTVPVTRVRQQRSAGLWLIGAVLAGALAAAVTIADQMIASSEDKAIAAGLVNDAERIAAAFDAAARSAHLRADGISTTPMLRAAIETDAATLRDMANTEMMFTAEAGETLEIFQLRSDQPVSLLRIPRTAAPLAPLPGRDTRVVSDGRGVTLLASAPISGYSAHVAGGLVIATPVDLSMIRRTLAEHAISASLIGLGKDIAMVSLPAGVAVPAPLAASKIAVPASGSWSGGATMIASARPGIGLTWAWQARTMSGGLAGILLVGFIVSLARRPRM